MEWFKTVFGVYEDPLCIKLFDDKIKVGKRKYDYGKFRISELSEFDDTLPSWNDVKSDKLEANVKVINENIMTLENNPANNGATFQISSNANCLEFRKPLQRKSEGITGYVLDRTQGPYAVICTPASILWRNYFMDDVNLFSHFPDVKLLGGYPQINSAVDGYKNLMNYQVGVHEHCEVLLDYGYKKSSVKNQFVNHVICSGLPFGYTVKKNDGTLDMNRQLLRAQYRLTLLNAIKMGSKRCFLTRIGASAYGMGSSPSNDAINYNRDIIDSGVIDEVFVVERS